MITVIRMTERATRKEAKMNAKLAELFARRSIRKYTSEQIGDDILQDLLEAAMAAPSAVAKDPWHFIIVRDKATLNQMADELPNGQMLRNAPVGILVCGDINKAHGNELSYLLQDCSAAIENLLIAVSILGLGACWLGVHPRAERVSAMRRIFSYPENIIAVSAIALGHIVEPAEARTRYQAEAIHNERW